MSETIREPASRPCGSCPYRCDVPSGVWDASEYERLAAYDRPTAEQPTGVFLCHQQDAGRICAGWAGTHDMGESLGVRLALMSGAMSEGVGETLLDYQTDVPLFGSGAEAAEHGMRDIDNPSPQALRVQDGLVRKHDLGRISLVFRGARDGR